MRRPRQLLRRKMQAGRRRRHRSRRSREDRLIALAIGRIALAIHVRRQRKRPHSVQVEWLRKLDPALAARQHFAHDADVSSNRDRCSHSHLSSRAHHASRAPGDLLQHEQLDFPVIRKNSRGHNPGVVEHDQITRAQHRGEVREHPVLDFSRRAIQQKHPRAVATFGRALRDQLLRQSKIIVPGLRAQSRALLPFMAADGAARPAASRRAASRER